MTVVETDRIAMADESDELTLDSLFESLEAMPVPEGYKVEIVGGTITMSPQRDTHWTVIRRIVRALEDRFGMDVAVLSDVRIDFPGHLNGFAPDVVKLADGAESDGKGRWHPSDVRFVAEVLSRSTALNDHGPKKTAYATACVPVYLIVDPYIGRCHVYTEPKDGEYAVDRTIIFGADIDLTGTDIDLVLKTDGFPRD